MRSDASSPEHQVDIFKSQFRMIKVGCGLMIVASGNHLKNKLLKIFDFIF